MEVDPRNSGEISEILDKMANLSLDSEVPEITESLAKLSLDSEVPEITEPLAKLSIQDDEPEMSPADIITRDVEMVDADADAVIVGVVVSEAPQEVALPAMPAKIKLPPGRGKVASVKYTCSVEVEVKYTN